MDPQGSPLSFGVTPTIFFPMEPISKRFFMFDRSCQNTTFHKYLCMVKVAWVVCKSVKCLGGHDYLVPKWVGRPLFFADLKSACEITGDRPKSYDYFEVTNHMGFSWNWCVCHNHNYIRLISRLFY